MAPNPNEPYEQSAWSFLRSRMPQWDTIAKWLEWPPDTYAMSAMILGVTGAHRHIAHRLPPCRGDVHQLSQKLKAALAPRAWIHHIEASPSSHHVPPPPSLDASDIQVLQRTFNVSLRQLRNADILNPDEPSDVGDLVHILIQLHQLADFACTGLGRNLNDWPTRLAESDQRNRDDGPWPSGPLSTSTLPADATDRLPVNHSGTLYHLGASALLASTGTLSRIPQHVGIVLPKVRTPAVGHTLRSLSLNVTFHISEADVIWRSLPWLNSEDKAIHLLVVPKASSIPARAFRRSSPLRTNMNGAQFQFQPDSTSVAEGTENTSAPSEPIGPTEDHHPDNASAQHGRATDSSAAAAAPHHDRWSAAQIFTAYHTSLAHVNRIHAIVLPESSMTREELTELQLLLEARNTSVYRSLDARHEGDPDLSHPKPRLQSYMPMIICGLRGPLPDPDHEKSGPYPEIRENSVVLSKFYAGRWYTLQQHKHHPWRLDRFQITNYHLSGYLSGSARWREDIKLHKRRICCLSPNNWLLLSPLICEDLARQDPMSSLIRGIGPNLIVAVLQDGPQIGNRWPARYASVLSDDPGTSVLTVTSLGMAMRSVPPGERPLRSVASWRDPNTGWAQMAVDDDDDAIVLSLTAEQHSDTTADGRDATEDAPLFELAGFRVVPTEQQEPATADLSGDHTSRPQTSVTHGIPHRQGGSFSTAAPLRACCGSL